LPAPADLNETSQPLRRFRKYGTGRLLFQQGDSVPGSRRNSEQVVQFLHSLLSSACGCQFGRVNLLSKVHDEQP
jgi:hypothetical protein